MLLLIVLDDNNITDKGAAAISNDLKNLTILSLGIFIINMLDNNNIGS